MASRTVYSCDATGAGTLSREDITTLPVKRPDVTHGLTAVGEIDLRSDLVPESLPVDAVSYDQERVTTDILCEGDTGMGGSTPYARIIGCTIPGERSSHHRTLGRQRVIEEYGETFVNAVEKAIYRRHVAGAKQSEYPDVADRSIELD